jgi:hypothetical protein
MSLIPALLLVLLPLISVAQSPTPQEQLMQCQSLLRIKTDLPCRCDQVEHLAAVLLQRAEKAEQALRDARKEEAGMVPRSETPAENKRE